MKIIIIFAALLVVAYGQQVRTTPARSNFRNEFDHLMVATATEQFHHLEDEILQLSEEVAALVIKPDRAEKERILREITHINDFGLGARGYYQRELQRTDLNVLERFNFEAAVATINVLDRDLTALATQVNAIKVN